MYGEFTTVEFTTNFVIVFVVTQLHFHRCCYRSRCRTLQNMIFHRPKICTALYGKGEL